MYKQIITAKYGQVLVYIYFPSLIIYFFIYKHYTGNRIDEGTKDWIFSDNIRCKIDK